MPMITYVEHNGTPHTVASPDGISLMEAATLNKVPGIEGDCGGFCACGTCHVYLCARGLDALGPATGAEMNILEFEDNATAQSRLACQIKVAAVPDGLTFTVAGDQ